MQIVIDTYLPYIAQYCSTPAMAKTSTIAPLPTEDISLVITKKVFWLQLHQQMVEMTSLCYYIRLWIATLQKEGTTLDMAWYQTPVVYETTQD